MRRLSGSLGLLLLAGSFSPRPASAQEVASPAPSVQLTLASALERARRDAPSVLTAAAQTAIAAARREDAGVSLLPTLSASAGLNAGANKTSRSVETGGAAGLSTELESESLNTGLEASLNARWLLWDFGRAATSEEALAAALAAASSDEQTAQRSAVLRHPICAGGSI